jgi:hypothetical protein
MAVISTSQIALDTTPSPPLFFFGYSNDHVIVKRGTTRVCYGSLHAHEQGGFKVTTRMACHVLACLYLPCEVEPRWRHADPL